MTVTITGEDGSTLRKRRIGPPGRTRTRHPDAGSHAQGVEQGFRAEGTGLTSTDPAFFDRVRIGDPPAAGKRPGSSRRRRRGQGDIRDRSWSLALSATPPISQLPRLRRRVPPIVVQPVHIAQRRGVLVGVWLFVLRGVLVCVFG